MADEKVVIKNKPNYYIVNCLGEELKFCVSKYRDVFDYFPVDFEFEYNSVVHLACEKKDFIQLVEHLYWNGKKGIPASLQKISNFMGLNDDTHWIRKI